MNDLMISLIISAISGFCFFFLPDYSKVKSWQMTILRSGFVLSLIAMFFVPFSLVPLGYIFHVLSSMALAFFFAFIYYLIILIIAWIFGISSSQIIDKIAGVKY